MLQKNVLRIHLIFLALFILLPVIYFAPMFFEKKELVQHDIMQFQGMAKSISDHREKYHEEPLWATNMFSGMPAHIVSVYHGANKIRQVNDFLYLFIKPPVTYVFTALLGFYILLLAFDVSAVLAGIGAIGFAFASFMFISIEAGHNSKVACISYMPLVLAGMVLTYRKNWLLGISVFGIGLALQIVNNHVQITYYLAAILLAYFVAEGVETVRQKTYKKFITGSLLLAVVALLAAATNASYFMITKEYSEYSIRGKAELTVKQEDGTIKEEGLDRDYVFNYSNSFTEPMTFLIPDYFGGASSGPVGKNSETAKALKSNGVDGAQIRQFTSNVPLYFGEQPFVAGPIYLGAIFCFLFVLGLLVVKSPLKWALLAVSFLGLLLSFGKNFPSLNYLLFDHFPLYNKFRSVTMAVVIPQLCVPLLGILGLKKWLELTDKKVQLKQLLLATGITGGLALLVFIAAGGGDYTTPNDASYQLPEWLLDAIRSDRKGMRTGDALRSFVFILLAAGALYGWFTQKIKQEIALGALLFLTVADLWLVDKRYLNNENFEKAARKQYYEPTEADKIILADKTLSYRVFNLDNPFNDARTSYFHQSVGGYSPAKMRRYQDLIEQHISKNNVHVLNMLNTKYVMTGKPDRPVEVLPGYLGNGWFVTDILSVKSPDEEIAALENFNPAKTAVVDVSRFKTRNVHYDSSASSVTLTEFRANYLVYEVDAAKDGFAVFSEIYYPKGWQAFIDGKPADHIRVNYVLRGMEIPAGKHKVEFKFHSESFDLGSQISTLASVLLLAGFVVGIGLVLYQERKKD